MNTTDQTIDLAKELSGLLKAVGTGDSVLNSIIEYATRSIAKTNIKRAAAVKQAAWNELSILYYNAGLCAIAYGDKELENEWKEKYGYSEPKPDDDEVLPNG